MKKGLRITFVAAAFCLLGLICVVIHGMNERRIGQLTCAGVKVEFMDDFNFVTVKDVEGYLNKGYGAYIGQRLDSVDLRKVENVLDGKSAILKAEAYTTPDGYLNVRIRQSSGSRKTTTGTTPTRKGSCSRSRRTTRPWFRS